MSQLSEANRSAIYSRLTADSQFVSLSPGGAHFLVAPQNAAGAYTVFSRIPVSANYALSNNLVFEADLWLIKAIVSSDYVSGYGASELAEMILSRIETVLSSAFSVPGAKSLLFRREREMPPFPEKLGGDVTMHHHGAYFRAITNV